jgi:hypothetical protein
MTTNLEDLLTIYDIKKNQNFDSITNYQYIFEITKCCGYSEWITVYKDQMLSQLYENIKIQFYQLNPINIYAIKENGDKLSIPNDSHITFRNLVVNNYDFFKPLYPFPAKIIYKIYFEDGCCHKSIHDDVSKNSSIVDSTRCIIHG